MRYDMEKNNTKQTSKAPVFIVTALIYITLFIMLFQTIKEEPKDVVFFVEICVAAFSFFLVSYHSSLFIVPLLSRKWKPVGANKAAGVFSLITVFFILTGPLFPFIYYLFFGPLITTAAAVILISRDITMKLKKLKGIGILKWMLAILLGISSFFSFFLLTMLIYRFNPHLTGEAGPAFGLVIKLPASLLTGLISIITNLVIIIRKR
jgi:hypothetical protein